MVKKSTIFIARKQELPLDSDNSSPFLKVMISIAVFLFAVTLAGVMSINAEHHRRKIGAAVQNQFQRVA